jgi:DNA ligase (NAD+)
MDIEHLGEAAIEQLVTRGLVKDFGDLYDLSVEQVAGLDRFAEKSAANLVAAIAGSRARGLARLLNALGIRLVGERGAQILARRFGSMARLQAATVEALDEVRGLGPEIARSVATFFAEASNRHVIAKLERAGVVMRAEDADAEGPRPLTGTSFVLTGALPTLTREAARDLIERSGGRVTSTVSKKTGYVVVGEAPGSKADDARRLGVTILDEAGLLALLAGAEERRA